MLKYLITHPVVLLVSLASVLSLTYIYLVDTSPVVGTSTTVEQPIVNYQTSILPTVNKKKITTLKVRPENTVLIFGEIGENSASIANRITSLSDNDKPTVILINSPGGSVMDGALIVSAIEASHTPTYAICLQLCASMAAIIESHATKRLMIDRSVIMYHPAAGQVSGTTNQMRARLSTITRYVDKMDAVIAKRAGLPLETFLQMQSGELWVDAEDAVNQKLADGLVSLDLSEVNTQAFRTLVNESSNFIKTKFNIKLSDF